MDNELALLDELREKYLSGQNIFRRNSVEYLLEQIDAQATQLQAIATAAREVMRKHDAKAVECNFTICGCDYCDAMRPQLAALEQETK